MKSIKATLLDFLLVGILALALAMTSSNVQAAACPTPVTADTTLTADCTGPIVITVDNVTLDCNGHTVTGTGSGNGIRVSGMGITVKNCTVTNFSAGFFLTGAGTTGNLLEKNTASGNGQGFVICCGGVTGNILKENTANNNTLPFHDNVGFRANAFDSPGNLYEQNTASGNGGLGGFFVRSNGSTFTSNIASNNGRGFFLESGATGNTLEDNTASGNTNDGFVFRNADNNFLKGNLTTGNAQGFFIQSSSTGNTLESNEVSNNTRGCRDDTGTTPANVLNTWSNTESEGNGPLPDLPAGLCPPDCQLGPVCDEHICKTVTYRMEDGDCLIEVGEKVDFKTTIEVGHFNHLNCVPNGNDIWTNVVVGDCFFSNLDVTDVRTQQGTFRQFQAGNNKTCVRWKPGDLGPGESATLVIDARTGEDRRGRQEYRHCSNHTFNNGALLRFTDPHNQAFRTGPIVVSVLTPDAAGDCDGDGFSDQEELDAGTDPHDPEDNPCTGVDCSALDDECNAGVCNPDTGACEADPLPFGTPCQVDDGGECDGTGFCDIS